MNPCDDVALQCVFPDSGCGGVSRAIPVVVAGGVGVGRDRAWGRPGQSGSAFLAGGGGIRGVVRIGGSHRERVSSGLVPAGGVLQADPCGGGGFLLHPVRQPVVRRGWAAAVGVSGGDAAGVPGIVVRGADDVPSIGPSGAWRGDLAYVVGGSGSGRDVCSGRVSLRAAIPAGGPGGGQGAWLAGSVAAAGGASGACLPFLRTDHPGLGIDRLRDRIAVAGEFGPVDGPGQQLWVADADLPVFVQLHHAVVRSGQFQDPVPGVVGGDPAGIDHAGERGGLHGAVGGAIGDDPRGVVPGIHGADPGL